MLARSHLRTIILSAAFGSWAAASSAADIDFVNQFRSVAFKQTGNATLVDSGAFFSVGATVASGSVGSYTDGNLSFGDPGSPNLLGLSSSDGGTTFKFQSSSLPTQSDMDAALPVATTYTYTLPALDPSAPAAVATLVADFTAYPLSRPQLTGNSFNSLQAMNAALPLSLTFSSFEVAPGTTEAYVFFSIFDHTDGSAIFPVGFAPPTTAGVTLLAGELAPGHSFSYELIFSDRVLVAGDGANFAPQLGFDLRSSGDFSTAAAVPEPQTWALLLTGLAVFGRRLTVRRAPGAHGCCPA
jgi:hypothetical protein